MRLISDQSGFGKVYEAYERSVPKLLKVLKENHVSNEKALELFQQEAIVLSQLRHPGVPAVEADGYFQYFPRDSSEPLHCVMMEKIDGLNLKQWMKQQGNHPISEKQALNWLSQITEILHLVHQKNYFHRDIKPENIMLRSTGQLVLVDFGAAREMTFTYLAQLGGTGGITRISSAGYTPPEQEHGQAVPQSDFYALGFTFVYLLTGKQPTDYGMYDSLHNEFCWREHAPHISEPLANFIDRLIASRAADRPKNTHEILAAIAQLQQQVSYNTTASSQPSIVPVTSPPDIITAAPSAPTVHQSAPTFKKRWLLGGVALLVLGLGGYGSWQAYHLLNPPIALVENISGARTLAGHTGFVNTLAISSDGRYLISGSADDTIKIWEMATGEEIRTLEGHSSPINTLVLSGDGRTLASGASDSSIKLWEMATGEEIRTLEGHSSSINALVMSPDGRQLISGAADNSVRIWDVATGQTLQTLAGHTSSINALEISPDGQMVMSASADKTIRVWNRSTGRLVHTLSGHTSFVNALVVSPDGQQLFSGAADSTIKSWNLATGQELQTLTGHTSFVNAIAISLDGRTLISGSADQTLRFWDVQTGNLTKTVTGYNNHINHFVISPDWQAIASGSGRSTITLWRMQP